MIRRVAVVVPAADEQERIAACLHAVHRSVDALHRVAPSLGVDIVVVLDDCHDATGAIVADVGGARVVRSTARCVGAARARGTAAALHVRRSPAQVWTAHTDADSQVPADWLTEMVAAEARGADVVLGTVVPSGSLSARTLSAWRRLHRVADGHNNVHGANLGIRASTLDRLGGWRALPTGEDVDLAERAAAAGVPIRRSGAAPVRTSARAFGRAPEGFSSYLRALSAGGRAESAGGGACRSTDCS